MVIDLRFNKKGKSLLQALFQLYVLLDFPPLFNYFLNAINLAKLAKMGKGGVGESEKASYLAKTILLIPPTCQCLPEAIAKQQTGFL